VAASGLAVPTLDDRVTRAPTLLLLWAIALAGIVAAATTVALGLANDELDAVGIRVFLNDWLTLNYIGAGLIAWWRRPDSRFGPLMIAAGFVNFVATLDWATADVPFTIGIALDMLAPVLFLHAFLAYPSGRLVGRSERAIVLGAYATAIGLGLVRMVLGGAGPRNLLEVVTAPRVVEAVQNVQLLGISAFCLAGIGALAVRRWGAGGRTGNRDGAADDLLRRRPRPHRLSGGPTALASRCRTGNRLARGGGRTGRRARCAQGCSAGPIA